MSCYFSAGRSGATRVTGGRGRGNDPGHFPARFGGWGCQRCFSGAGNTGPTMVCRESKTEELSNAFQARGAAITGPEESQWATPTTHPRKRGAVARQIDFVACKGAYNARARILPDSHFFLGTGDHDCLLQTAELRNQSSTVRAEI